MPAPNEHTARHGATFGWRYFDLLPEHITLLRGSYVDRELSKCEYGAAAINPKRPYGNSAVVWDMLELLGLPTPTEEELEADYLSAEHVANQQRVEALHKDTPTALQIVLATGSFEPGRYRTPTYFENWERVVDNAE